MAAVVSIILPTKNSARFLEERIKTIREQTYADYEVIALDTASTDGTLERLEAWSREDPRVSIHQVPPGVYAALNRGVELARGEYVYFAMSDDTMKPQAIERMVCVLEAHPECDVCDTKLEQIGEDGGTMEFGDAGYLYCQGHFVYDVDREGVRDRPLDFLMHCGGKTVYVSLTQILVRKKIFEKTGCFPEDMGSSADYKWGMMAALNAKTYYLPESLATWRIRTGQLTGSRSEHRNFILMCEMAKEVYSQIDDLRLKREAGRLLGLIEFKMHLLPIKRKLLLAEKVYGVFLAMFGHPIWFAGFAFRYLAYKVTGSTIPAGVQAYDCLCRAEVLKSLCRLRC